MPADFFEKTFKNLQMPVLVCENKDNYPIVFANTSARLLFNPMLTVENLKGKATENNFDDFVKFQSEETRDAFLASLKNMRTIAGFKANLLTLDGESFSVYISSNIVNVGSKEYFIMYASEGSDSGILSDEDVTNILTTAFQIAYNTHDVDEAINKILGLAGTYVDVSRVYIFEETSPIMTRNTYEWCN